jgi:hypothetical protein
MSLSVICKMGYSIKKHQVIDYPSEKLREFHSWGYEYIDNLHFILPPDEFIDPAGEPLENYLAIVRERFFGMGWDGDGEIGLLWLPQFVFPYSVDVSWTGVVVWFVKQLEDGISFLLSPIELPIDQWRT